MTSSSRRSTISGARYQIVVCMLSSFSSCFFSSGVRAGLRSRTSKHEPKSHSLNCGGLAWLMRMFSIFRSRWTSTGSMVCITWTPRHTSRKMRKTSPSSRRFCRRVLRKSISPPPAQHSIRIKISQPSPWRFAAEASTKCTIDVCPCSNRWCATSARTAASASLFQMHMCFSTSVAVVSPLGSCTALSACTR